MVLQIYKFLGKKTNFFAIIFKIFFAYLWAMEKAEIIAYASQFMDKIETELGYRTEYRSKTWESLIAVCIEDFMQAKTAVVTNMMAAKLKKALNGYKEYLCDLRSST